VRTYGESKNSIDAGELSALHRSASSCRPMSIRCCRLVRPIGLELSIHPIQWALSLAIGHGSARRLATPSPSQPGHPHQPFHAAARHDQAFAQHLAPDCAFH